MKKVKIKSPDMHLVTVHTVNAPLQAELIKNMLAEHNIQADLGGEHQAGFSGTLTIEIIVKESDSEKAAEFINVHFPNS